MTGLVTMGVSAAGEPTVARGLADDRWPWLERVGRALVESHDAVVAYSALRHAYRERLRAHGIPLVFIHLDADTAELESRAASREDHFMPPSLLASQLATLEHLHSDEAGVRIDVDDTPEHVLAQAVGWVRSHV